MMKFIAVFIVIISATSSCSGLTNVSDEFSGEVVNASANKDLPPRLLTAVPLHDVPLAQECKVGPNAKSLFKQATLHIERGSWKQALEVCHQLVNEAPGVPAVYFYRSQVYWELGLAATSLKWRTQHLESALADASTAVHIVEGTSRNKQENAQAYGSRGLAKLALGNISGAEEDLAVFRKLNSTPGLEAKYEIWIKRAAGELIPSVSTERICQPVAPQPLVHTVCTAPIPQPIFRPAPVVPVGGFFEHRSVDLCGRGSSLEEVARRARDERRHVSKIRKDAYSANREIERLHNERQRADKELRRLNDRRFHRH
ncbi:MAG TPA: hypothetical protein VEB60_01630 [Candidatus Paceibacterota bacterium]|nr:hypothetical protein [Candidatus Paceibacterota bacterium]